MVGARLAIWIFLCHTVAVITAVDNDDVQGPTPLETDVLPADKYGDNDTPGVLKPVRVC